MAMSAFACYMPSDERELRSDTALVVCEESKRTATLRSSGISSPNLDHTATRSFLFGTATIALAPWLLQLLRVDALILVNKQPQ
jgi:hypothetical protein